MTLFNFKISHKNAVDRILNNGMFCLIQTCQSCHCLKYIYLFSNYKIYIETQII